MLNSVEELRDRVIGGYRLERLLGRGRASAVFLGVKEEASGE
jgi:hypothetical protein